MGKKKSELLSEIEELLLMAILRLGGESYGVPIHEALEHATGSFISIGAIYANLERLKDKGFVTSRTGEATQERGGRAKKYFKIEGAGVKALDEAERIRRGLRDGRKNWEPAGGIA